MSQSKIEWSVQDVFKIINLYRQFACLWDIRSPVYKRTDLKRNAWQEIAKNMDKDEDEVRKKIKHLRSAYVAEKRKVESCRKSGSSAEEIYFPHLFYYDEFNFLNSAVVLRKTASNLENEESPMPILSFGQDNCLLQDTTDTIDTVDTIEDVEQWPENLMSSSSGDAPKSYKKCLKRRKVERDDKFNGAIDAFMRQAEMSCAMMSSQKEEEDMYTAFGKSNGLQLSKLSEFSAAEAMAEMQGIVSNKIIKDRKSELLQSALRPNYNMLLLA